MNTYQKHLGGYESAFYYQHTLKEKEEGNIILNFIKKRRKTERDCVKTRDTNHSSLSGQCISQALAPPQARMRMLSSGQSAVEFGRFLVVQMKENEETITGNVRGPRHKCSS